jgi:hypothetical protein
MLNIEAYSIYPKKDVFSYTLANIKQVIPGAGQNLTRGSRFYFKFNLNFVGNLQIELLHDVSSGHNKN